MGLNLKEKLQNLNKRNVIIVSITLLIAILFVIGGIEYFNYQKIKAEKEAVVQVNQSIMFNPVTGEPRKPSEYAIGIEYDKAMKGKKPVLALFYADWCHYCVRFMPTYQALYNKYGDDIEFAKVNVEDEKYQKVVQEVGITGYPTVFILDPKYDNKILLSNAILGEIDAVSVELDRFIRIRKLLDSKK